VGGGTPREQALHTFRCKSLAYSFVLLAICTSVHCFEYLGKAAWQICATSWVVVLFGRCLRSLLIRACGKCMRRIDADLLAFDRVYVCQNQVRTGPGAAARGAQGARGPGPVEVRRHGRDGEPVAQPQHRAHRLRPSGAATSEFKMAWAIL